MNSNESNLLQNLWVFSLHEGPAREADLTQIQRKLIFFFYILVISSYFMAQHRMTCKNKRKDTLGNI